MKIHKLKFTDRSAFESLDPTDKRIVAVAIVGETGLIPLPTEFDEEGNPLPVQFRGGFHVDVLTTEVIQEWKDFTITGIENPYHSFGIGEVITQDDFNV